MINKLILLLMVSISLYADSKQDLQNLDVIKAWKDGVIYGIRQLDVEYRTQGIEEKDIHLKKYAVVLNTNTLVNGKGLSTSQKILYKSFGSREGLSPILLTNNLLVFASYDNPYDADELIASLNKHYFDDADRQVYRFDSDPNTIYKLAPFAFADIMYDMMDKVKTKYKPKVIVVPDSSFKSGFLSKTEEQTAPKVEDKQPNNEKKPSVVKHSAPVKKVAGLTVKKFKLANSKAMSYSYEGDISGYKHKWKNLFKELGMIDNNEQKYEFANIISTEDGEQYVKVLNKRIFFDLYDIAIEEN